VAVAIVLSAALTASVTLAAPGPSPSRVVYPVQRLPLRFSHAQHTGALAVACTTCHDRATTSRSALDLLTPAEAACRGCHAIDRARPEGTGAGPASACVACHPGYTPGGAVARIAIPAAQLKFSHAAHVSAPCARCHGDLAKEGVGLATRDHLPRMETCMECHDGAAASDACTTCHLATQGGRVRTELPDGRLVPAGGAGGAVHDADFRVDHARVAQAEPRTCASCHEERFCADCHLGTAKPMDFHPGDYATMHAVDARRNVPDCATCHTTQRFCVSCHERSGVGVRGESGFATSGTRGRFHPPGWAAGDHAADAQKNIRACASCHREDFCLTCHTAEPGSARISPHGPGWRNSSRCRALANKNQRMCLRCHIELGAVGCD
jgi:predicted CXXCH cytochrome family protein